MTMQELYDLYKSERKNLSMERVFNFYFPYLINFKILSNIEAEKTCDKFKKSIDTKDMIGYIFISMKFDQYMNELWRRMNGFVCLDEAIKLTNYAIDHRN